MNLTSVKNLFTLVFSVLLWMNSVSVSQANIEPIPPFMGDWEGGWVDAPQKDGNARNNPGLVARVIGLGNNRYEIQILEEFDNFESKVGCDELSPFVHPKLYGRSNGKRTRPCSW